MMAQLIINEFSIKKKTEREWVCEKREKATAGERQKKQQGEREK